MYLNIPNTVKRRIHTVPAQKSNIIKKMSVGKSLTFSFIMIIRRLLLFARLSYYFSLFLFATYQAHRLLTSGLKAHKVVHASLGSRFGQQDLYLPILIEILMIYFFQYGSFGGGVTTAGSNAHLLEVRVEVVNVDHLGFQRILFKDRFMNICTMYY